MPKSPDLTNQTFHRLTANSRVPKIQGKVGVFWNCDCSCGAKDIIVHSYNLRSGNTKSCGCLQRETAAKGIGLQKLWKHRKSRSIEYNTWNKMLSRCYNPEDSHFDYYGGRNIQVCAEWRNNFEKFLHDMGERAEGLSLDRINVNGNYEPGNCRWATIQEQNQNRRNSIWLEYRGEKKVLSDWAREVGILRSTIQHRLKKGWTIEEALETKPKDVPERFRDKGAS